MDGKLYRIPAFLFFLSICNATFLSGQDEAGQAKRIGQSEMTTDVLDPFSPHFKKKERDFSLRQGFYLSMQGGFSMSNMVGEDVSDRTYLTKKTDGEGFYAYAPSSSSFLFGGNFYADLSYRFSEVFSQGIGLGYIQKGAAIDVDTYKDPETGAEHFLSGDVVWLQNYLSIIFPFSIHFSIADQHESYLKLGIFFAYLLEAREEGAFETQGQKHTYSNDLGANSWERGFFLGFGYTYFLPKDWGNVFVETRWIKSQTSYGIESAQVPGIYYNQTLTFNLGYSYAFGQTWFQ